MEFIKPFTTNNKQAFHINLDINDVHLVKGVNNQTLYVCIISQIRKDIQNTIINPFHLISVF